MSEPIATVEDVRSAYVMCDEDEIAFDVWLASVKADAWDEGVDAQRLVSPAWEAERPVSPYRGEQA
jgi:hypothetical protein